LFPFCKLVEIFQRVGFPQAAKIKSAQIKKFIAVRRGLE